MRPRPLRFLRSILLLGAVLQPACFSDLVVPGGVFTCEPAESKPCPEGYVCGATQGSTGPVCVPATPGTCGDGVVNAGEQCDGAYRGQRSCADLGFWAGELTCDDQCQVSPRGCLSLSSLSLRDQLGCGLDTLGRAWCWGMNDAGQFGDGTVNFESAAPVPTRGGHRFDRISTGGFHVCALSLEEGPYCWGSNGVGQLGVGDLTGAIPFVTVPQRFTPPEPFIDLSAGYDHACALGASGAAWCWGSNDASQLGGSTDPAAGAPVPVSASQEFKVLSAGRKHTCGLALDGRAFCWGSNGWAQLGDGTFENRASAVAVAGDRAFQAISAGDTHTCALDQDGAIWCWGGHYFGQCGDGTEPDPVEPAKRQTVRVAADVTFVEVSAGERHTCGLSQDGRAYCWGYGPLGPGSPYQSNQPVLVDQNLRFTTLASGWEFACGLRGPGALHCWGLDNTSQAGQPLDRTVPTPLFEEPAFTSLSAGWLDTCGLAADGVARCWGQNAWGEAGTGRFWTEFTPREVAGGLRFASIRLSVSHGCGLTLEGSTYCWGSNGNGELGNLETLGLPVYEPTRVDGDPVFQGLSTGGYHSCGLSAAGRLSCWGYNGYGQLGDGSLVDSVATVDSSAVAGLGVLEEVAAGAYHTCVLAADQRAHCWGFGYYGQIGDGSTDEAVVVPRAVLGDHAFRMVRSSGHSFHTCGLSIAGAAWCWGANGVGQLGDGTRDLISIPNPVRPDLVFQEVFAGDSHTCAIDQAGRSYCWGLGKYQQLGTRDFLDVPTEVSAPVLVPTEEVTP